MVRPHKLRRVGLNPNCTYFKPRAIPLTELEEVIITQDALEAVRLVDLEGLYQDAAAEKMEVSRPTIGRILEQARKAIADALINGKAIRIEGGNVTIDQPCERSFRGRRRGRGWKR
ncbi:MAG: DUF134 domain-containing protein [Pseudomonadota bacterium]